jgi:uncharacterized protein YndB with AHSA1/START domain
VQAGKSGGDAPEFTVERTLKAPRRLVWEAFTRAEHLVHWWGPKGFALDVVALDVRPGGLFHYKMTGAAGVMWGRFVYRELDPPARMTYVSSFSDPSGGLARAPFSEKWPLETLNVMTFEEKDGATRMLLRATPMTEDADERAAFLGHFASMRGGFGATFDQFDVYLADLQSKGDA